ncbi:MAG: hypothetical protein RIQ47_508 [Bacteroidota bacterium]|jgi:predicted amidohydrolase
MEESLHITLLQTSLHWENREENLSQLTDKIKSLSASTDLIVLPEMFTSGFTMHAALVAEPMQGPTMQWMHRMASDNKCVITGSVVIESNNSYFNRLIWMQPDGTFKSYDKRHLFRLAGEEKTYTQGTERMVLDIKGWRIFPLICYDLRFPVWSRRTVDFDFDLMLYVANWPERRNNAWKKLLPARAIENQSYVAAVNRIGADGNGIHHSGDSILLDYFGESIAEATPSEESVLTAKLDKKSLVDFRNQFPFGQDGDPFEIK